jgi:hypothetical protein
MKRRSVDEEIDASIAAVAATPAFVPSGPSAWVATFEQSLPFRLPPSYRSLLLRYRFPSFSVGAVTLFGNLDGKSYDDFTVASMRDPILSSVLRANALVQIGRPESGSYDPICFDLRARTKDGEAGIVRLDHEEILINASVQVVATVASSFLELLAGGSRRTSR